MATTHRAARSHFSRNYLRNPANVRLPPGVEDGYEWKPLPGRENLFNEDLFTKQLSKHSIGAYMELCRGVEVAFEAAVMVPCQLCA